MPVDLTVPESSSPIIDRYKELPQELRPFALFVHIDLENVQEVSDIERVCNDDARVQSNELAQAVRRASPRHDFRNEPLQASIKYFLEILLPTEDWDFFYFVAVVDEDWREKGVLLVTMDDGTNEERARIDIARVPAAEAGLDLVNLQIANTDWEEYKDAGSDGSSWEDEDSGDESGNASDVDGEDDTPQPWNTYSTDEDYTDGAFQGLKYGRYWVGLYARVGFSFRELMRELTPAWSTKSRKLTDHPCRPQGRLSGETVAQLVAEAARLHPMRCRNNPSMHRTMFLIVDGLDHELEALLLVKLDWDTTKADDHDLSYQDLAELGEKASTDFRRFWLGSSTLIEFDEIARGDRPWRPEHKCFFAYAGPAVQLASEFIDAIDDDHAESHPRFLQWTVEFGKDQHNEHGISQDVTKGFRRMLKQHWGQYVGEERFRVNMHPEFLVFCNEELGSLDKGKNVYLVKTANDADWSTMTCAAGDAYQHLCDLVDGNMVWNGTKSIPYQGS